MLCVFIFGSLQAQSQTIAIAKRSPVIDGVVNKFEYAFGGTGFFNLTGKVYSEMQSRYYLSYDDKNLYIAVITPTGQKMLTEKQMRDDSLWEDDSVEIYLVPGSGAKDRYQFIFNSKGVFYDSKNGDVLWNIKALQIASKVKENQWILEIGLPLDEMSNIKSDSWKINICRSFKGNEVNTTLAPCNMAYSDAENFVNLKLTEDIPFIDIGSIGNLNSSILDFKMDLLSGKNTDVVLSLESPKNVLPYQFEKQISLEREKAETVTAKTDNLPPDNVLNVNLKLKSGMELYKAALKYKEQTPVVVSYIYTDIDKQILNTVFSSSKKLITGDVFIFKMIDEHGKIVLEEKIHPISQNLIFTVPVNIGKLAPGEYKFVLNCADKNGNVLLDHGEMFQKPSEKPSWKDTKVGISDKVPAPWTPVAATVNQFSCWGRIYSFGGSGILSSLKSQAMEMLSDPIHLTIDGVSMMETSCELIFSNETTAKYHLTSKSNSLKVNADITAEFDGFIWIKLTYAPISGSAEIRSMTLDIPLERKYISYFDDCQSITSKTDLTGNKDKVIANNFMKTPACWIGGDDVGLMVGAENLKGWYIKNKRKSMEIIPSEKTVTLRLNLVDTNLKLTSARISGFIWMRRPQSRETRK